MDLITILGIAIGLAMDCFAVAISTGTGTKKINRWTPYIMAFLFGFFQFGMLIIGWAGTSTFKKYIINFDHWIAFLLLLFVGIKMLKEGFETEEDKEKTDYSSFKMLMLLSFATSFDSLAVGISFSLIDIKIFLPAIIIGLMSFLFTGVGFIIGKKTSELFGKKAEIIGGLILIFIGLKILIEHLR
ncbi:MAG: manganese efflux pump MntP family protein [Candidatus Goldbacteria bacterium]|nr:manganese efflux pump MntP family protein [Candidatus Goldiibacteriota bacterium]